MKIKSNYQDLIKLIALVSMIIDHAGLYLFPDMIIMRVIGRYAMPIFCFFAGYNFKNTPQIKVLFYGIFLHAFSQGLIFQEFIPINILVSIFLGQIYIWFFQKQLRSFYIAYSHVVILGALWIITHTLIDYGTLVIAIMILGQIARNNPLLLKLVAAIACYLSLLHSIVVFYNLGTIHILLTLVVTGIIYLSIIMPILGKKIPYNINFLTRNTMLIYCMHLVLIETYWKYALFGSLLK